MKRRTFIKGSVTASVMPFFGFRLPVIIPVKQITTIIPIIPKELAIQAMGSDGWVEIGKIQSAVISKEKQNEKLKRRF